MINHSKPTINRSVIKSWEKILSSGQLSQDKYVNEFERKMSAYVGVKGGVAVNSGTSAIHLSLVALGIKSKDEVIIPSYVCCALLNAIHYVGAIAKVVDVNYEDGNISVKEIKKHLSPKVKAIIVPHMFGHPADVNEILRLGVPVIEDCAQSIGAEFNNKKTGSFGVLSICSFYATKMMTTGEGGMVLSNNSKILASLRDLREYDHLHDYKVRFNYKMTEMQAALGIEQLRELPNFIRKRESIAKLYDQQLANKGIEIPLKVKGKKSIYFRYVIKVTDLSKQLALLNKNGILARRPIYKSIHQYFNNLNMPVTDLLMKQNLSLPIYPDLTLNQAKIISRQFN